MSLYITSLNSGSNGNCYYIGNDNEAVLIDVGISCREIEKRMKRLGLKMGAVKAAFISHEHGDHIRGVEGLAAKHKIPVYITPTTLKSSRLRLDEKLVVHFNAYESVEVGGLAVLPFPKLHDAIDPHSFVISCSGVNVGVFTDIGVPCEHVIANFKKCHAIFLEANYDEEMLEKGSYPHHLKKRINGDRGHLSNRQALELFLAHRPSFMSSVYLSHLSKENNDPNLAAALFAPHAGNASIMIASRYSETEVHRISPAVGGEVIRKRKNAIVMQPTLF